VLSLFSCAEPLLILNQTRIRVEQWFLTRWHASSGGVNKFTGKERTLTRSTTWMVSSINLPINTFGFTTFLNARWAWNKGQSLKGRRGTEKVKNYWSRTIWNEQTLVYKNSCFNLKRFKIRNKLCLFNRYTQT